MRQRPWQVHGSFLVRGVSALALCGMAGAANAEGDTVVVGTEVPSAESIQQGLFPDDECEKLKANGFKCMGFKPPVRFSLPSTSFKVGSAELPDGIKRQLDAFADVLKGKSGSSRTVRIEGHADASGDAAFNQKLSQMRADAARDYLVGKQVAPDLLKAVGVGSNELLDPAQPTAARNRRVVIGRDTAPSSPAAP
jgi:OmpA-OmpF porin, OOP family